MTLFTDPTKSWPLRIGHFVWLVARLYLALLFMAKKAPFFYQGF